MKLVRCVDETVRVEVISHGVDLDPKTLLESRAMDRMVAEVLRLHRYEIYGEAMDSTAQFAGSAAKERSQVMAKAEAKPTVVVQRFFDRRLPPHHSENVIVALERILALIRAPTERIGD